MRCHRNVGRLFLFTAAILCQASISLANLPDPPLPRSRREVESVLAKARTLRTADNLQPFHVVLVADKKDHGPCEHDYPLWQKRWKALLSGARSTPVNLYGPPIDVPGPDSSANTVTVTAVRGWPTGQQFASADVVVVFCYVHWDQQKLTQLERYLGKGGGFVLVHSATWTRPKPSGPVADLTGCGGFTQYRHGPVKLKIVDQNYPICLGLPREIHFVDETYWPPTPCVDGSGMHILATCDEKVGKGSAEVGPQPMFWTHKHGEGRVFGCVLGHYTWTFDDPYFRLLLLRGIAWSARQSPYRLDPLVIRGVTLRE